MSRFDDGYVNAPESNAGLPGANLHGKTGIATGTNSPTSSCMSSQNGRSNHGGLAAEDTNINISVQPPKRRSGCYFGGFICAFFIKEDCRKSDDLENEVDGEGALFCTLCNAEVHSHMWMFKFELFNCPICLACRTNFGRSEKLKT
jgi:palmitoyltransferase